MFTTGSKYFLGVAGFAAAVMVLYIVLVDGAAGGAVALASIMVASALLAGLALFNRDGDAKVGDQSAPANAAPVGSSLWPLVSTVGVVLLGIGLITHEIVFILGLVALFGAFVEWVIQGWSESASSERAYNASVRERIMHPLEWPVLAVVGVAVLVVSFSRIMLAVDHQTGAYVFIGLGTVVLIGGTFFALRPNLKKSIVVSVCSIAVVLVAAAGLAGVAAGKRSSLSEAKAEKHFAHKECGEEKSEHFDFNAESTVSMRSNPVATVEFVDGKLRARELGLTKYVDQIMIPRGNDVSVLFRNKTDGDHRLTLFYGTTKVSDDVVEENLTCTQMIGNDKEQILTFKIPKPSIASDKPYEFYVPGVEGQSIEVVVP